MPSLIQTIKSFGLSEFYFSLSVEDKTDLARYSRYLTLRPQSIHNCCSPNCEGCFMVTDGAQFLWATAANAIPEKKFSFAEKLLSHALTVAEEDEDLAWIHANLAQIYYEAHKTNPGAARKSIHHCRELIRLGFMKTWAQNMMEEIQVFQV